MIPIKRAHDQPRLNGRFASNGPHGWRPLTIVHVTAETFTGIAQGETIFTTRLIRNWQHITAIQFIHRHNRTTRRVLSVETVDGNTTVNLETKK